MTITPHLFEAHLQCPTKCWLRATGEPPSGNTYAEWVKTENASYRAAQTERLLAETPPGEAARSPAIHSVISQQRRVRGPGLQGIVGRVPSRGVTSDVMYGNRGDEVHSSVCMLKSAKWRLAVDVVAQASAPASPGSVPLPGKAPDGTPGQPADGTSALPPHSALRIPPSALESRLHAIERVPSEGRGKAAQFIPIRFIFRNKLTKDDKLLLAFDAFVLGQVLGRDIAAGKIIHGDLHGCACECITNSARASSVGGAGDSPAPVGDPPTGTGKALLNKSPLACGVTVSPIPSGGSPDGTGRLPVLPNTGSSCEIFENGGAGRQTGITTVALCRAQPRVTKVKTMALAGEVRKRLDKIAALLATPRSADSHVRESEPNGNETRGLSGPRSAATPPDLVLNRHCAECEFRDRCRKIAIEKDDLSLLAGMSAKERQKLRGKGIFTVTQLSYTFRPRRRPKRLRDKREKYHHSLKALAIREQKIHIVGSPELKIEGTPVYLDVEGLPDRDFYYLIGLRIGHGDSAVQHSLWADTVADEGTIWREFLSLLETVEKPVLIHYGSYETTFLDLMQDRFVNSDETEAFLERLEERAVNLLTYTYGQVYFPTYSNGLKDVAGFMGLVWPNPEATGRHSVMWRQQWDGSQAALLKQQLLAYNSADCRACELLANTLSQLSSPKEPKDGPTPDKVAFVAENLPNAFSHPDWRTFVSALPELNLINRTAQWDYQRDRIYLRTANRRLLKPPRFQEPEITTNLTAKAVLFPPCPVCPTCFSESRIEKEMKSRYFNDLVFGHFLVKGRCVRHDFKQFWCEKCRQTFGVPRRFHSWQGLGWHLIALYFYMAIELGFPQRPVAALLDKLFGISISAGDGSRLKARVGQHYEISRELLMERLINAAVVHVDETKARVRSGAGYVWVFATSELVVYLHNESREAGILQLVLRGFKGVLVSDFYTAYDSLDCPQQKCLVHLIRDMNNEILAHPYDEQLKRIVRDFAALLKPIIETIDRFGLRKHHLRKFSRPVDRFFKCMTNTECQSEAAQRLKQRFEKNRDRLFTFLHYDDVPWHNNNAEHAVKAFARLRCMFLGQATPKAISEYLVLLSLCQTCKYMGVDFLDFLRSGEKDLHAFAESRRGRRRRSKATRPTGLPVEVIPDSGGPS